MHRNIPALLVLPPANVSILGAPRTPEHGTLFPVFPDGFLSLAEAFAALSFAAVWRQNPENARIDTQRAI